MTSTRNINTRGDYNLEQNNYLSSRIYTGYKHSAQGCAYNPSIPSIGITPGRMSRNTLSHNPVDIESALFGINSTNLVNPQPPIRPQLKKVPTSIFFERIPVHMPKPLVIENNQRPYPI
jgi:hypothetical protein